MQEDLWDIAQIDLRFFEKATLIGEMKAAPLSLY